MADTQAVQTEAFPGLEGAAPSHGNATIAVVATGLLSTAATLFALWWLDSVSDNAHVMGWYADYVLPVGPVLAGIAAGSGYGLASWVSGVKISRGVLWTVVILQLVAYAAAQYVEFTSLQLTFDDGSPVGFVTYFDVVTRAMAWQEHGTSGAPFGAWGYLFRALEAAGFAGGGLIVPLMLRRRPYCEPCQVYMRTTSLGLLPAGVKGRIKRRDTAAQAALQQSIDAAVATAAQIGEQAASGRAGEVRATLAPHSEHRKAHAKLSHRVEVLLCQCGRCHAGVLATQMISGHGKQTKVHRLAQWPVDAATASGLQAPRGPA